ncbi:S-layer homology domain-containing protein [Neobacillus sp. D3-1R]|uniref:S-layer homology domain-containing protein n=1 Tax=Neobacillus sp. D3-1R TaxID=3445778 RepID=UPI003FA13941
MRLIRLLFVLILTIATFPVSAFADQKTSWDYVPDDIDEKFWAYNEITDFMSADIMDGIQQYDPIENYKYIWANPNANITRAQFTKMMVNAMNLKQVGEPKEFIDVKPSDWYVDYVNIASSNGVVKGVGNKFNPNAKITRDQMALMIYRAFKDSIEFGPYTTYYTDIATGIESEQAINYLTVNRIMKGFGASTFGPKNFSTRAQAIVTIHRAIHQETSHLPTDEEVIGFMTEYLTKERELFLSGNWQELAPLYKQYETGYSLAASLEQFNDGEFIGGATFKSVGDFTISVVSKNNNYAEVQIDNLVYQLSNINGEAGATQTLDLSSKVMLRRDTNGNWKAYDYK